ncbi:hypothetical protein Ae201684P_000771 [Aphanomyces euteiches]|uniref:Uncharacterized protein n=1 Tax=Aphanomyces euteiches TaxID=100861 RepID=A0A6G0XA97_9STRA|nr:hypothetical protein Ae201684_006991 [Aphanomyces euteiches]KAH9087360.1 hypothetical protein Ae201684P_000771 [Aphanomyces euteiches]
MQVVPPSMEEEEARQKHEEEEVSVRIEMTAWSFEVRHLLSRLICLGTVYIPPTPRSESRHKEPETGGSPTTTEPTVFTLLRNNKCPLLWTLKGGSDGCILRLKGRHDVVLFPQAMARFDESVQYVHTLEALTFVRMDATALQSRPATMLEEIDAIHNRAASLKQSREAMLQRLTACGPAAMSAFRSHPTAKAHKLALAYIFDYMKTISKARTRCRDRLRTRQTQFQAWFNFMGGGDNEGNTGDNDDKNTVCILDDDEENEKTPASTTRPSMVSPNPAAPVVVIDLAMKSSPTPKLALATPAAPPETPATTFLVRRNPSKGRIIHWHVEKLVQACCLLNPGMVDARDVAETIKEAIDYLMPLESFSANQMNQTILAIEKNLSTRPASEIRHLVAPLALGPYLTQFFPTPIKKAPKLPALNRRGCRVHFSNVLLHVKHFYADDAPTSVQSAKIHSNNDNIKEGASVARRPSLPSQTFDTRPQKYIRMG